MADRLNSIRPKGGRPRGTGHPDQFAALADPTRRHLLGELAAADRTVAELASGVRISQPAVSQHLKVLRDSGLVIYYRVGRSHHYQICTAALCDLGDWILELERSARQCARSSGEATV